MKGSTLVRLKLTLIRAGRELEIPLVVVHRASW